MGAAETERAGGGRGRGAARVGRASKPAGRGKRQLPEKRHGSHAAFQLPPSPPGREREIEYRERVLCSRFSWCRGRLQASCRCRCPRPADSRVRWARLPARPPASSGGGGGVRGDSNCQNCCHAARGSGGRTGVCTGTATRGERRDGRWRLRHQV